MSLVCRAHRCRRAGPACRQGSNPDLFVLTVPLSQGNDWLAMLSFIGGFSSATSMVIVTAMALVDDGIEPCCHADLAEYP